MGLYVSHDCWRGSYSKFMLWRRNLCVVAGLPPLDLMQGFCLAEETLDYWLTGSDSSVPKWIKEALPIRWDCLKPDSLYILLSHSDCDGEIEAADAGPLADSLQKLLDEVEAKGLPSGVAWPEYFVPWTMRFIAGLRKAYAAGESVEFS